MNKEEKKINKEPKEEIKENDFGAEKEIQQSNEEKATNEIDNQNEQSSLEQEVDKKRNEAYLASKIVELEQTNRDINNKLNKILDMLGNNDNNFTNSRTNGETKNTSNVEENDNILYI